MESSISQHEALVKKKLQRFLWELANFGSVRGFKHFSCYLRGKEELLVSVKNKVQGSTTSIINTTLPLPPAKKPLCATDSFNSYNLPYDKSSIVFSLQTQTQLRGRQDREADLLPASPSEEESQQPKDDVTLFLIAGYARYSCPYVWVRSNHRRLFTLSGDKDADKDSPLKLKSTSKWQDEDVKIFDIVAEIVKLCTYPAPRNPFEVDLDYFNFLKQPDQLLASAAMTFLLQKIVIQSSENKVYIAKVFEELQLLARIHFKSLRELTQEGKLAVLLQHKKGEQKKKSAALFQVSSTMDNRNIEKSRDSVTSSGHQMSWSTNPAVIITRPGSEIPKKVQETSSFVHNNVVNSSPQPGSVRPQSYPNVVHAQLPGPMLMPAAQAFPPPASSQPQLSYIPSSAQSVKAPTAQYQPSWSLMTPSPVSVSQSIYNSSVAAQPYQDPFKVYNSIPVNASGITYGKGPRGAFPGGYDRMPAPSML
ncbi:hypothetical protein Bpfe_009635 [Biomphalaria pfeifferi]|uniref:DUF7886 domain-containing protein n=1 Tax=Biomphalaria pfeifferi TaxID=112525 RepID=A0AAD8BUI9_BIOPF|nr:hypothetical protein Bpfe_009635 [Biomphalaria pfeifferi]